MTTPANRPTHRLYSVCKTTEGKSSWTEIGAAHFSPRIGAHKDGNGFSFKLKASVAPGGEFIMRRDTRPTKAA
jgi:hypothetical protein